MADIVVAGYAVRFPLAGNILAFAQHVAGLRRLGHRVRYAETGGWPDSCYDPVTRRWGNDPSAGIRAVTSVLAALGAAEVDVAYLGHGETAWVGTGPDPAGVATAELLIDLGGVTTLDRLARCDRRLLVDMDPAFTQGGRFGGASVGEHDRYATYGTNIGGAACTVPTGGVEWVATVPPVLVDHWQRRAAQHPISRPSLTTVANVDAYGSVEIAGRTVGQKWPRLERIIGLPGRIGDQHADVELEIAITGASDERCERLRQSGWRLVDAEGSSRSLDAYTVHLLTARGEFSVAKEAYVVTRTGWVSDRTACLLAAGRPAVVEDTGFRDARGPVGVGLVTWDDADAATRAIDAVVGDPERHRAGALEWARAVFAHDVVLPRLVDLVD